MPRSGQANIPFLLSNAVAFTAITPAFFGDVRVFWRKFVPGSAVRFRSSLNASGESSRKSLRVDDRRVGLPLSSALNYRGDFKTAYLSQSDGNKNLSVDQNAPGAPLVSLLLFLCRPITIVWLVISVVVAALYARASGTLAHVGGEITKRFPPLANRDASASIIAPLMEVRVSTSAAHALPDGVKGMRIFERHNSLFIRQCLVIQGD